MEPSDEGGAERALKAQRRTNLATLRDLGSDPFAQTRYDVDAHASEIAALYATLAPDAETPTAHHALAGRLLALRKQGKKVFFADLWDRSGKLQLYVRADVVGEDAFAQFDQVDLGDIIGASGTIFRTKSGELTLRVDSFAVLSKALVPLPDKHHGGDQRGGVHAQLGQDGRHSQRMRDVRIAAAPALTFVRGLSDLVRPLHGT